MAGGLQLLAGARAESAACTRFCRQRLHRHCLPGFHSQFPGCRPWLARADQREKARAHCLRVSGAARASSKSRAAPPTPGGADHTAAPGRQKKCQASRPSKQFLAGSAKLPPEAPPPLAAVPDRVRGKKDVGHCS